MQKVSFDTSSVHRVLRWISIINGVRSAIWNGGKLLRVVRCLPSGCKRASLTASCRHRVFSARRYFGVLGANGRSRRKIARRPRTSWSWPVRDPSAPDRNGRNRGIAAIVGANLKIGRCVRPRQLNDPLLTVFLLPCHPPAMARHAPPCAPAFHATAHPSDSTSACSSTAAWGRLLRSIRRVDGRE